MPAVRKSKGAVAKTHAARKPPAKAKKKRGSRKKKLNLYQRTLLRIMEWRDRILGYRTHALVGTALILTLTVYVAFTAGFGRWLADEVDDRTRAALVAGGLSIEQIRLEGRNRADLDDVSKAIGIIQGESILHYDLAEARARLEQIEWVEDARVIRFLPKTIHIVLRERSPVAIWQMDGVFHLVDAEGFIINQFDDLVATDLPLIVGGGAPEHAASLFDTLEEFPDIKENFASAIRVADRRWDIRLTNGVEINLPADNIHLALSRVVRYDAEHDLLRQEIKSVDMRLPDRVYLKLTDEEASRLWTARTKT